MSTLPGKASILTWPTRLVAPRSGFDALQYQKVRYDRDAADFKRRRHRGRRASRRQPELLQAGHSDLSASLGTFGPNAADIRPTPQRMAVLARKLGGAILVGHSQSSSFPTKAALQDPTGVEASSSWRPDVSFQVLVAP